MTDPSLNGWTEYRALVLAELKRIDVKIDQTATSLKEKIQQSEDSLMNKLTELDTRQRGIDREVIVLKVKAGLWGLVGASVPAAIAVIWTIVKA